RPAYRRVRGGKLDLRIFPPLASASGGAYPPRLFVPDVDDLVALQAAGGLHVDALAGFLADERARDRGADGDAALLDVGLVLADDLPGGLLAVGAFHVDGGAEHAAAVGVDQLGIDHLRVGELCLELGNAAL